MGNIIFNQPLKYREICEMMEDKQVKSTNSKKAQLKKWQLKYEIIKDKTWYTILRKLSPDEEKQMLKEKSYLLKYKYKPLFDKYNKNSDVIDCDFACNHGGVYKFQYENIVYIGQTNNFYSRFTRHIRIGKETKAGKLLLKGGFYEIIAVEEDLEKRLSLEQKYIKLYSSNNDYICINDNYNSDRINAKTKRKKARYKNVKINYNDWERVREILEDEGIEYE